MDVDVNSVFFNALATNKIASKKNEGPGVYPGFDLLRGFVRDQVEMASDCQRILASTAEIPLSSMY